MYREQRVDVLLYVKAEPTKKLILENVFIEATELTSDILSKQSDAIKQKFSEMFGSSPSTPIIAMVNANCKGYCRALLDQTSIDFFMEFLSEVDA